MKYMGSKNRFAKEIVPIIQSYIDSNNIENYLEPFVGGANIIDKIKCKNRVGCDNNKYLIALLRNATQVGSLPDAITREQYSNVKRYKEEKYSLMYVGAVGFLSSYNGKFFGGYAGRTKTKDNTIRNYYIESKNNLIKQSEKLKDIQFKNLDFRQIENVNNTVIYCDPPYKGTTKYKATGSFPYDEYYDWCRKMAKNNIVICSEYSMPNDFECIWERKTSISMNNMRKKDDVKNNRVEKLFICK